MQVALRGLAERDRGPDAAAEAMNSERARWRRAADKNLIVLGTLGNNVPFVGLFGTVLGVINAFEHLAAKTADAEAKTLETIARRSPRPRSASGRDPRGRRVQLLHATPQGRDGRRRRVAHAVLSMIYGRDKGVKVPGDKQAADGGK